MQWVGTTARCAVFEDKYLSGATRGAMKGIRYSSDFIEEGLWGRERIYNNVCRSWEGCSRPCKHPRTMPIPHIIFCLGACPGLRHAHFGRARLPFGETVWSPSSCVSGAKRFGNPSSRPGSSSYVVQASVGTSQCVIVRLCEP